MHGFQGWRPILRQAEQEILTFKQPKAPPAQAPSTPAGEGSSTPAAPPAPAASSNTAGGNAPGTPTPAPSTRGTTTTESTSFNDPSALALGSQREAAIANMESMGFARADIDRAMRAAFFNPDRAVEYLLNVCDTSRC